MAGDFPGCAARKKSKNRSVESSRYDVSGEGSKQPQHTVQTTRGGLRVYKIVILGKCCLNISYATSMLIVFIP